jgi:membrane protein
VVPPTENPGQKRTDALGRADKASPATQPTASEMARADRVTPGEAKTLAAIAARWVRDFRSGLWLVGRAAWGGVVGVYYSDDITHAASIAYYALLSLFPVFMIFFAALGVFTADASHRAAITKFLLAYFPTHFDFFTRQLDALPQMRLRLGIGGAAALVWAALGVFGAINSAVNHAWGVEQQRSYLRSKLFAFLMLLAAGLLLLVGFALASAIQIVQARWFAEVAQRAPGLHVLTVLPLRWGPTLIFILVVGFLFYFVPNTPVRFRDVWIGAVLTGLLWRIVLEGFSLYLRDMSRFKVVHGSIAAVVVFLVWVYTSAVVFLYGVEFTAAYAHLRREARTGQGAGTAD